VNQERRKGGSRVSKDSLSTLVLVLLLLLFSRPIFFHQFVIGESANVLEHELDGVLFGFSFQSLKLVF